MTSDRDQLLRAAADHLARRPNATQDEIAKAIGISRATLHRHFAGRRELLAAVEESAVTRMDEALRAARLEEGTATQALHRLTTACEPVAPFLALLYTQGQDIPEQTHPGWEDIDERILELFRRGQRSGEFTPDLSAAWLTEAFYSLVAGAAWSVQSGRVAARDFQHMITDLLLHGVASAGRPSRETDR
ncbi:TetR/AcrR family transcriptional regulator [Marinactinospora thermotolerans]|uniref:Transcriptional regulator, TetR family n=1 Tax=Marinactinospora thermotolerans DSM 45154 TaxID=1122192 RepID=A0A1T4KLZ7_9ACTN|nr:TetR/AcrR family transcriptional regulator [Marinactinospora thermotolerans]SJZ43425.1 transcriptional regulator, TetR family [Marinactinospora thermotolerans DSM 45154]